MSQNLPYYLGFSYVLGIGPYKFKALIDKFGRPKKAYQASEKDLRILLGPRLSQRFLSFRRRFKPDNKIKELYKKNIQIITQEDRQYPNLLRSISDPPICLFLRGNKNIFVDKKNIFFSVVGARKMTEYGKRVVGTIVSDIARSGLIIVSGMALGIDGLAHRAALNAGGKTVAVMGCGVDIIYPSANTKLYYDIINNDGAVISEFPPGTLVKRGLFVSRNRIISGLSRGVLVVEGEKRSGTLITAKYAAEQGRDVFAPPMPLTSASSQAPNILIKQGAKFITRAEDILEEYNIKPNLKTENKQESNLSGFEKTLLETIANQPHSVDELARILKQEVRDILETLSLLELKGIVSKGTDEKYYR